MNIDSIPF